MLVSSHILSELEQVCDWLIVIDHGALVYQGPARGFLGQAPPLVALAPEHDADLDRLAGLVRTGGFEPRRNSEGTTLAVRVDGDDPRAVAAALNRAAMDAGIVLAELKVDRPTLESHYLAVVEGGSR